MCGRYKQLNALQDFLDHYGIGVAAEDAQAGGGRIVAPSQAAHVIRPSKSALTLSVMTFGFTPRWAKEGMGTKIINARAETLDEKPSFRKSLQNGRCIVPMAAFFEWDKAQKPTQAYEISLASGTPLAVAGLWECWVNPQDGTVKEGFAIITTTAAPAIARIHARMPALLVDAAACTAWLSPVTHIAHAQALLRPCESPLTLMPVTLPPARTSASREAAQLALF